MLCGFALAALAGVYSTQAQGTAFTYQGRLADNGSLPNANYDIRFTLYDALTGGSQVGSPITKSSVPVNGGLFTTTLDFGAGIFAGADRFLNIEISPAGAGTFTALSARQPLTPSPYAIYAGNAATLGGQLPAAFAPSSGSSAYVAKAGDTMTGTLNLPANGLNVGGSQITTFGGNVGVGISPGFGLDVNKELVVYDNDISLRRAGAHRWRLKNLSAGLEIFQAYDSTSTLINQTRLTVADNGNVGIGTTSPAASLDVAGNAQVQGSLFFTDPLQSIQFPATSGANAPMMFMFASGTANADRMVIAHSPFYPNWGLQYQDLTDKFNFLNSGSPVMTVDLGNSVVGIGTASPDRSLTIANGSGANYMNIKDGTHEILMGVDAAGGIISVISAHDLILRAGGNSEKMRIQAGGNVGIGTATPAAQLDVVQGSGSGITPDSAALIGDAQNDSDGIWGASGAAAGNGVVGVCNNGTSAFGVWGRSSSGSGVVGSGTTYGGQFTASGTGLFASGTPAIQTSGSVGINASPTASLYVQGTTTNAGNNTADFFDPSLGPNHSHIHWGTLGHWYIRSAANIGCVIMQDQDPLAWVGIGGTPSTKLTVIGNICASGTIGACSDARFKDHVQTLNGALETVLKLRGVQFNWKTREFPDHHFTEQPQVGFIAQEVNQVLPEVVAQGKDGFYSVDYGRLTPVLVEAVKEQQEQLRAKDTKLAALEKANAEIQKELAAQKELTSRIEARFARLEKVVAGLGDKSAITFAINH